jgi:hypothetical protein
LIKIQPKKKKTKEMLESGMSYRTATKELDIIPQTNETINLIIATKFTQRTSKTSLSTTEQQVLCKWIKEMTNIRGFTL